MPLTVLLVAALLSPAPVRDVSAALPVDANRMCELSPAGLALFDGMEKAVRTGPSTLSGGLRGRVTVSRRPLKRRAVEHTHVFRPEGALVWQGLPVAMLQVRRVLVPESEGLIERGIGLAVPLERLERALNAAGHPVARAPDHTVVEVEPFDGAARIGLRGGTAFFSCEYAF